MHFFRVRLFPSQTHNLSLRNSQLELNKHFIPLYSTSLGILHDEDPQPHSFQYFSFYCQACNHRNSSMWSHLYLKWHFQQIEKQYSNKAVICNIYSCLKIFNIWIKNWEGITFFPCIRPLRKVQMMSGQFSLLLSHILTFLFSQALVNILWTWVQLLSWTGFICFFLLPNWFRYLSKYRRRAAAIFAFLMIMPDILHLFSCLLIYLKC